MKRLIPTFLCLLAFLNACSPQYNWREVHGNGVPFTALLPGKSDTFTQPVELNGAQVPMTMTATEVGEVTFAIGTASFSDAATAQKAMAQMQIALVRNINGSPIGVRLPGKGIPGDHSVSFGATGSDRGKPMKLIGRLSTIDNRVYQVIMVGNAKQMNDDITEMFFTSFKAN